MTKGIGKTFTAEQRRAGGIKSAAVRAEKRKQQQAARAIAGALNEYVAAGDTASAAAAVALVREEQELASLVLAELAAGTLQELGVSDSGRYFRAVWRAIAPRVAALARGETWGLQPRAIANMLVAARMVAELAGVQPDRRDAGPGELPRIVVYMPADPAPGPVLEGELAPAPMMVRE